MLILLSAVAGFSLDLLKARDAHVPDRVGRRLSEMGCDKGCDSCVFGVDCSSCDEACDEGCGPDCPPGYKYSPPWGKVNAVDNNMDNLCHSDGSIPCDACPSGKYKDSTGNYDCYDCAGCATDCGGSSQGSCPTDDRRRAPVYDGGDEGSNDDGSYEASNDDSSDNSADPELEGSAEVSECGEANEDADDFTKDLHARRLLRGRRLGAECYMVEIAVGVSVFGLVIVVVLKCICKRVAEGRKDAELLRAEAEQRRKDGTAVGMEMPELGAEDGKVKVEIPVKLGTFHFGGGKKKLAAAEAAAPGAAE